MSPRDSSRLIPPPEQAAMPAAKDVLVVGFGNELRGDDGAGPHVALAIQQSRLRGVRVLITQQLAPELAESVSQAEEVIFVDAVVGGAEGVQMQSIATDAPASSVGHVSDPRSILALAQALYGRAPKAWLVAIPASHFEVGSRMSPATEAGVAEAVRLIRSHVGQPR